MNKLVVLSGVPGSGKSYFSKTLIKIKKSHVYLVSSDEIRRLISGTQSDLSSEDLVWKIFYGLVRVYAQDKNGIVILDATNYSHEKRIDNLKEIKPLFNQLILISYDIDHTVVYNQNFQREYPIPPEALNHFFKVFEPADDIDKEFYHEVIIIKDTDISHAISKVLEESCTINP